MHLFSPNKVPKMYILQSITIRLRKKTNWFCKNHKKPQNAENSETKQTRSGETPVIQTNEQLEKNVYTL